MPNIFKVFSRTKAEPYRFPDAAELAEPEPEEELPIPEEEAPPGEGEPEPDEEGQPEAEAEVEPEPEEEVKESPISFAQVQAQEILADARQAAERILQQARDDADREAENVFSRAREEGYQEGYAAGMAQASQESKQLREEQAQRQEEEVHRFLEQAGTALDRQMDQSVADLRDLAMAVAEKVVCVSLKSSADVISRMIQTAIEKKKKTRVAYEEMRRTCHQLQSGVAETDAYREFGRRCRLQPYLKFSSLLEQNRKTGTKNMRIILQAEMADALEQRKNLARRLGEEAGTKLLMPLFMTLGIIMVMIMVPAMMTMG